MEKQDVLRRSDLTNGLTDKEIEDLSHIVYKRHATKGEMLFKEGDASDELFIIAKGRIGVLIYSTTDPGQTEHIASLRDGDIFGEFSMIDGTPRSATVAIEEDSDLLFISYVDFHRYLNENEHVGFLVMNNIAKILTYKLRKMNLIYRNAAL